MSVVTKNPFLLRLKWYIDNQELEIVENIDYLGAKLANDVQNVGLCYDGLNMETAMHILKFTCKISFVLLTHDI